MWSTNGNKCLLFILASSQLILLILFWRHISSHPERGDIIDNIKKRRNCDCEEDKSPRNPRFNIEHNLTQTVPDPDLDAGELRKFSKEQLRNDLVWKTTSQAFDDESNPVLVVAVMSARAYKERRRAVRETWLQECHSSSDVVCRFFTDAQDGRGDPIDEETIKELQEESANNRGDLVLLNTPSGVNFALRLLALFEWANETLSFDYLLRIDDDQFLCLERLLAELPYRPRKRLYWGYMHCTQGIVRIDEGFMILSADLVQEFLRDRDKLLCHKYGDQAMAMWIYRSMKREPVLWFGDARVYHDPPASFLYEFRERKEICHTFLSLHGSYPSEMREFMKILERERRHFGTEYDIPPVVDVCPFRRDNFDWNIMSGQFHTMPRPCKDEPIWVSKHVYQGRTANNMPQMPTQNVRISRVDLRYYGNFQNALNNELYPSVKKVDSSYSMDPTT